MPGRGAAEEVPDTSMDWLSGSTIAVEVQGGNFSGLQRLTRPETGELMSLEVDPLLIPWRASQVMMVHVDG